MTNKANMLSAVTPWDAVAGGYAQTTMRLFQGYADKALQLAGVNGECDVLDVACGPGTLTLAASKKVNNVSAIDFSAEMLSLLNQSIKEGGISNIETYCGDAQQLPYANEVFDVAFSMFGLMFFPDRGKGYKEIFRTLKPGGKVVISSWAPVSQSPAMLAVFGALKAMNPYMPSPKDEIESLENPEFFTSELAGAGFRDVEMHRVTQAMSVGSVETFWADMVKGSAPIVMLKNSLSDEQWLEKNQLALDYLHKTLDVDSKELTSDAWLGVACK